MANENLLEVYRQLRVSQDKYTYFLLAAAGAAIALAINQTHTSSISCSQIPLGLAVLFWGVSFMLGCYQLEYVSATLYANAVLLKIQSGEQPDIGNHPQMMEAASEGIRKAVEHNSDKANSLSHWQFRLIIFGALLYLGWHIWEMWLRTPM